MSKKDIKEMINIIECSLILLYKIPLDDIFTYDIHNQIYALEDVIEQLKKTK